MNKIKKSLGGRPPVNKNEMLQKIEPFLKVGYSLYKACILAKIPIRTAYDYYEKDEDFRNEVDRLKSMVNVIARKIIIETMQNNKDSHLALEWLDRMEKDEFSKRVEIVSPENKNPIELLKDIFKNEK